MEDMYITRSIDEIIGANSISPLYRSNTDIKGLSYFKIEEAECLIYIFSVVAPIPFSIIFL